MQKVPPSADDPKKLSYQQEWDEAKGCTQPLPLITGSSITFASEDPHLEFHAVAPVQLCEVRLFCC
jgi:hypothetical protein